MERRCNSPCWSNSDTSSRFRSCRSKYPALLNLGWTSALMGRLGRRPKSSSSSSKEVKESIASMVISSKFSSSISSSSSASSSSYKRLAGRDFGSANLVTRPWDGALRKALVTANPRRAMIPACARCARCDLGKPCWLLPCPSMSENRVQGLKVKWLVDGLNSIDLKFKGESSKTLKIHNEECLVYLLILHIAEMLGESNRVPRFSLVAISSLHLSFGLHVQRCSKFGSVVIFILSCSRSAFDKLNMDQQEQQVRSSLLKSHIGESLLQHSSQVKPMPYFGGWCGSHVGSETESKLCALASSWQKPDAKNCYGCKIAFWVPLSFLTVSQCCLSCSTSNPKIRNHPKPSETIRNHNPPLFQSHRGKGRSSIEAHWHLQPQRCVCAAPRHTKTTKPMILIISWSGASSLKAS